MGKVINLERYRRARYRQQGMPRARLPSRDTQDKPGLVSIGVVSAEFLRRFTEVE